MSFMALSRASAACQSLPFVARPKEGRRVGSSHRSPGAGSAPTALCFQHPSAQTCSWSPEGHDGILGAGYHQHGGDGRTPCGAKGMRCSATWPRPR